MENERACAVRDDDPLSDWPQDKPIAVRVVTYEAVEGATKTVSTVHNWGYFDGALLTLGLQRSTAEGLRIEGSAVMIAPGLAVTATHVFRSYWGDLMSGKEVMALQGIRSDGTMDMWRVSHISATPEDDMALLSISLMSKIHPEWFISTFPLTTRTPVEGELVTFVGFREDQGQRVVEMGDIVSQTSVGDLYVTQGHVGSVYPDGRDPLLLPYPSFEVLCGSIGSMSGGAVLDVSGKLVGVISRGLTIDDGEGPSYATVINEVLTRPVEPEWPPGLYPDRLALHEVDPDLLGIEGRDKLVWKDGHLGYEVW